MYFNSFVSAIINEYINKIVLATNSEIVSAVNN